MKQLITLFILTLNTFAAFSQATAEDMNVAQGRSLGSFEAGDTSFTLVSDANVRDKPATTGGVVAKLNIGTRLKIVKDT